MDCGGYGALHPFRPTKLMPELPEVETTRRGINDKIVKQKITQCVVRQPRLRLPMQNMDSLIDKTIDHIERRGKYLIFYFSKKLALIGHLGMSGSLRLLDHWQEPGKHDHWDIHFKNGLILRYRDPRRFGLWVLTDKDPHQHILLNKLGVEPLTNDFNFTYLSTQTKDKKIAIKKLIMDSKVVVGVGNIYANEALFMAGIHPEKPAVKVPDAALKKLITAIKKVLERSIKIGGTTLRDFSGANGEPGYFKQTLQVYGRRGKPCLNCGSILQESRFDQRSSVFCPLCQK